MATLRSGVGRGCAVALAVVLAAVPAAAARRAAALQPLSCPSDRAFFSSGAPTQLYEVDGSPGSPSLQPIGDTSHGIEYNALGWRPTDGLFYAVARNPNGGHLVRIDAAGTTEDIGATTPTLPNTGLAAGTFDAAGVFYLATGQDNAVDPNLYEVDVATRAVTTVALTSSNLLPNDFAFIAGTLWGEQEDGNGNDFIRIDPTTGQVDVFPDTDHVLGTGQVRAGAAWTLSDGSLNLVDNNGGDLFRVAITAPNSAGPTFTRLGPVPQLTPLTPPVNIDGTSCSASPVPTPTPTSPAAGNTAGGVENQGHAGSSNDPNPNTNPTGTPGADNVSPAATATTTQPTVSTVCSGACTLAATTGEEQVTVTATDATENGPAFRAASTTARKAPVFRLAINGGGAAPRCPGYRNRDHGWVQFGFRSGPGSTFEKTATMTSRRGLSHRRAEHLLDVKQVCFEAPYRFLTRRGFAAARVGAEFDGVLAGCRSERTTTAGRRGLAIPCVTSRQIVRVRDGWAIRLVFRVPPNRHDPKALG